MLVTSLSLGVSLSMDAFAASIVQGAQSKGSRLRQALRTALYFGTFEAITPIVGWAIGVWIGSAMALFDHWIAFGLLLMVGAKMIYDAAQGAKKTAQRQLFDHPQDWCWLPWARASTLLP